MAIKPFNDTFRIHEATGFTVINGEQVTKIVGRRGITGQWELTLHLSDSTTYVVTNVEWNKAFVAEIFPDAELKP